MSKQFAMLLKKRLFFKMKIKKYLPVLEYVSKLSPRQRKQFIQHASSDILLAISELCHNFNRGAIDISQDQLKKLRRYRKEIEFLCKKRPGMKEWRKTIQRGGFLGLFLGSILSSVLSSLFPDIAKK